jgi:hypothetical protein
MTRDEIRHAANIATGGSRTKEQLEHLTNMVLATYTQPVEPIIDWKKKFENAREAFLSLIADSREWGVEFDADTNSNGSQIDCSTFSIDGPIRSLEELCEALDIKTSYGQSIDDAIQQAVES